MRKAFLAVGMLVAFVLMSSPAQAALCFLCGSGSSGGCSGARECRAAGGKDTSAARKACKARGCKISGTTSCSTAANVKICSINKDRPGVASQISSPFFLF